MPQNGGSKHGYFLRFQTTFIKIVHIKSNLLASTAMLISRSLNGSNSLHIFCLASSSKLGM